MTVLQTTITNIGSEAESFKEENMLILFGENTPPELSDLCYNIRLVPIQETITPGMKLQFNDESYLITAVGAAAEENLKNLGHITINFDGSAAPELPGTIYVEAKTLPEINIGDSISIVK